MKISPIKLKALLRYFYSYTNPNLLGKSKLMKLFYFADFDHTKKYGTPITYDRYAHLDHGPIPSHILNLINNVVDNRETAILADTVNVKTEPGSSLQKIECYKPFTAEDEKYFSENEIKILQKTCHKFHDYSAGQMEELSHQEAPWVKTRPLEEIPYSLAAEDPDARVDKELIDLSMRMNK